MQRRAGKGGLPELPPELMTVTERALKIGGKAEAQNSSQDIRIPVSPDDLSYARSSLGGWFTDEMMTRRGQWGFLLKNGVTVFVDHIRKVTFSSVRGKDEFWIDAELIPESWREHFGSPVLPTPFVCHSIKVNAHEVVMVFEVELSK